MSPRSTSALWFALPLAAVLPLVAFGCVEQAWQEPGARAPGPSCAEGFVEQGGRCVVVGARTADAAAPPDVDQVVARNRPRFRECYRRALAADRNAEGRIMVTVAVGPDGAVASSRVISSTAPPELSECIARSFDAMRFSGTGAPAEFTVPVVLTAHGPGEGASSEGSAPPPSTDAPTPPAAPSVAPPAAGSSLPPGAARI
jgi:hypothetical protein